MTALNFGDQSALLSDVKLDFSPGRITLEKYRMVLLHTDAIAALRKELVDSLGVQRARGLLTRHGYESGKKDATLARRLHPNASDEDLLSVGPSLHTIEGIVKVTPVRLNINISQGSYFGEFIWEDSYEAEIHRELFGLSQDPVCWTLIGYATGYTSEIMGQFILYRETQCFGTGEPHCRDIGKPLADWDNAEEDLRYFEPDHVADQIMQLQQQVENLRQSLDDENQSTGIVGASPAFRRSLELLKKVADSHVSVLFLGETGTGKEVFARELHRLGPRSKKNFVAINCAALPEELIESELFGAEKGAFTGAQNSRPGRFERAHGGTLFLDEVADLSSNAQAKLLRVLQEGEVERLGDSRARKVDVRVIAATNCDMNTAISAGRFRSDLFYRLNTYPVFVPPLRDRKDDIPLLVAFFLKKYAARYGKRTPIISDDALATLANHNWPGNVRELEHVIERGIIVKATGEPITTHDLFPTLPGDETSGEITQDTNGSVTTANNTNTPANIATLIVANEIKLDDLERQVIDAAMKRTKGNLSAAARSLGLSRPQLAYRLGKIDE